MEQFQNLVEKPKKKENEEKAIRLTHKYIRLTHKYIRLTHKYIRLTHTYITPLYMGQKQQYQFDSFPFDLIGDQTHDLNDSM
jgi:hypothetical protein